MFFSVFSSVLIQALFVLQWVSFASAYHVLCYLQENEQSLADRYADTALRADRYNPSGARCFCFLFSLGPGC